jgi:hypothetical protein
MKQEPFRITMEIYGIKVTIEKPHSDIDIYDLEEMLRSLCLAAGWQETLIDTIFRNPEEDKESINYIYGGKQ